MIPSYRAPSFGRVHGSHGSSGRIVCTLGLFAVEEGEASFLCSKGKGMSVSGCVMYVCLGGSCRTRSFFVNLTL